MRKYITKTMKIAAYRMNKLILLNLKVMDKMFIKTRKFDYQSPVLISTNLQINLYNMSNKLNFNHDSSNFETQMRIVRFTTSFRRRELVSQMKNGDMSGFRLLVRKV